MTLQRQPADRTASTAVPPIVHEVLRSPGQPLDAETRAYFEPRFGHDFSHVRIHTDTIANASADVLDALAYTVGRHIVFGSALYTPNKQKGQRLLAHELTHVLQQQDLAADGLTASEIDEVSEPADRFEQEAELIAQSIVTSSPIGASHEVHTSTYHNPVSHPRGLFVQRRKQGSHRMTATGRGHHESHKPSTTRGTKDPSCASIYGSSGTPETHVLVADREGAITRVRENLDSWDPYLLADIPDIVNELYRGEEDVIWFASFEAKVIGEVIGALGEEMEPVKLLITGLAEIGAHLAEKSLEDAKKEMTERITARLTQQRDKMRDEGEKWIKEYLGRMRSNKEPGCGQYLELLYKSIDVYWPRMTAEKLDEAKQLVEQIVQMIQHEAMIQHLREEYEECLRLELYRPGGIPTEEEQAAAAEKCRQKTGYPV